MYRHDHELSQLIGEAIDNDDHGAITNHLTDSYREGALESLEGKCHRIAEAYARLMILLVNKNVLSKAEVAAMLTNIY